MREIKFRAWDKKSKKMRAINTIAFNYEHEAFNFNGDHLPKVVNVWGKDAIEDKEVILYRESKDIILLQFTGLLDKNGKEIYEGDVIKTNEAGWIAKVVYNRDGFFCIDNKGGFSTECDWEELEVIGNIYENPELLKC